VWSDFDHLERVHTYEAFPGDVLTRQDRLEQEAVFRVVRDAQVGDVASERSSARCHPMVNPTVRGRRVVWGYEVGSSDVRGGTHHTRGECQRWL
jgi:hypothetical protein